MPEYKPHVFARNAVVSEPAEAPPRMVTAAGHLDIIGCLDLMDRGASLMCPPGYSEDSIWPRGVDRSDARRPNLTVAARRYLERTGPNASKTYFTMCWPSCTTQPIRRSNAGALRMEWPRIPLPHWSELSARTGAEENEVAAKAERGF